MIQITPINLKIGAIYVGYFAPDSFKLISKQIDGDVLNVVWLSSRNKLYIKNKYNNIYKNKLVFKEEILPDAELNILDYV